MVRAAVEVRAAREAVRHCVEVMEAPQVAYKFQAVLVPQQGLLQSVAAEQSTSIRYHVTIIVVAAAIPVDVAIAVASAVTVASVAISLAT